MPFTDQFWRALADYGVLFGNLDALGEGTPPAAWITEYNRVRATAFAAVLLTSSSFEGGNSAGQKLFPQETLLDALHCRRFELDDDYALPAHLAQFVSAKAARASGNSRWHRQRFS